MPRAVWVLFLTARLRLHRRGGPGSGALPPLGALLWGLKELGRDSWGLLWGETPPFPHSPLGPAMEEGLPPANPSLSSHCSHTAQIWLQVGNADPSQLCSYL